VRHPPRCLFPCLTSIILQPCLASKKQRRCLALSQVSLEVLPPSRSMPLPKSLRRPVRRSSSSSVTGQSSQRKRCQFCNSLDPRGHANSTYPDEAGKGSKASLNLIVDALTLSKTKDVNSRGCRFCNVLVQSLDAFFDKWRGSRAKVNVELKEKGTIKVSMDGERWKGEIIEIYAGSGRLSLICCAPFS
jgi:hypothetical protein